MASWAWSESSSDPRSAAGIRQQRDEPSMEVSATQNPFPNAVPWLCPCLLKGMRQRQYITLYLHVTCLTPCEWQPEPTIAHKRTIDPRSTVGRRSTDLYPEPSPRPSKKTSNWIHVNPLLITHNPTQCPKETSKLGNPVKNPGKRNIHTGTLDGGHLPHWHLTR